MISKYQQPDKNRELWVIVGLIIVTILGLTTLVYLTKDPYRSQMAIDLLSVLFSWPIVVLILVLTFLYFFHKEISFFIQNVATIRLPGGEITKQQSDFSYIQDQAEKVSLTSEQFKLLETELDRINAVAATAEGEKQDIINNASNIIKYGHLLSKKHKKEKLY